MAVNKGTRLGHYEVRSALGRGGMGEVYLALDTRLGRPVALKLLPAEVTANERRLRRFKQEARATSALNHPNIITIHEIGEDGGVHFIATEFIEGETLRQRMNRAPLTPDESLDISTQIASALAAAHEAGVVHRDIKPENVMLRRDGYVKVLDFGLAKLARAEAATGDSQAVTLQAQMTEAGDVLGTFAYMSPEQARGISVDERSDVFSFGVVLYEMLAGRRPFARETAGDELVALLREEPAPLDANETGPPAELARIVAKCLEKDPARRYKSAREIAGELKAFARTRDHASGAARVAATHDMSVETMTARGTRAASGPSRRALMVVAVVVLVAMCVGGYFIYRHRNVQWAKRSVARVEEMARAGKYFEAYDLAAEAGKYLPNDATIKRLMPDISDVLTISYEPVGARVYLRRFAPDAAGQFPARQLVGTTPLKSLRVARGDYVLSIEKEGYAPFERAISSTQARYRVPFPLPETEFRGKLIETSKIPERMIFVPGGKYKLVVPAQREMPEVTLADFFIDKYEVSNRDYKEFINAGGYLKREFWRQPFVKDGKEIAWEEAMHLFKDRTGLPGPRDWSNGTFPEGREGHPVTGVTWYEASAYAAFRGKQLPTIYQWEKAARDGARSLVFGTTMPWGLVVSEEKYEDRGNFRSGSTAPVDAYEFGASPYGCRQMAGNVAEWCANPQGEGYTMAGGSWDAPPYLFASYGGFPTFYESSKIGFRCALTPAGGDQGMARLTSLDERVPTYTATSEGDFNALASHYRYDKSPTNAQVVEVVETDDWRREKIAYDGADDERALAYLFLPKNAPRPLQLLNYVPHSGVFDGAYPLADDTANNLGPYIRSGRAVFAVVLKGYSERKLPPAAQRIGTSTIKYREQLVQMATDISRGLDYLETRGDIDMSRIAYFGISHGATAKVIFAAVEPRYRAVVLVSGGLRSYYTNDVPEANPINFVPHILQPKLAVNGRYDENLSFKAEIEPLFQLMREPKRQFIYDGGHSPLPEVAVPVITSFLDETLGPVGR
jgi:formylglycine-generating enzyme required for sulfatase activity